ncbi:MAG TPA: hypothetical protein VE690_17070 [Rhodopila sp.]|nr:hypothetical protein [Rhodopila sp.]
MLHIRLYPGEVPPEHANRSIARNLGIFLRNSGKCVRQQTGGDFGRTRQGDGS